MGSVYLSKSTNPCINLALEEMLFEKARDGSPILFLWQNEKTVVIGQNQNPWKECNLDALEKAGGTLVRRKSGGGAVYHDLGNLNFTFLSPYHPSAIEENLGLIIKLLDKFGIEAVFQGRNDLLAEGFKISGNAYYVEEDILCHHGTLLVDVDFARLSHMLTPSHKKLESKGVDSVRARVANLSSLNPDISVNSILETLIPLYWNAEDDTRSPAAEWIQAEDASPSIVEKYRSWEWNFGHSPQFDTEYHQRFGWGEVNLEISATNGCIAQLHVYTDAMDVTRAQRIKELLIGRPFSPTEIDSVLIQHFGE